MARNPTEQPTSSFKFQICIFPIAAAGELDLALHSAGNIGQSHFEPEHHGFPLLIGLRIDPPPTGRSTTTALHESVHNLAKTSGH